MSAQARSEGISVLFFPSPSAVRAPPNASGITVSMGQVDPRVRRLAAAPPNSRGATRKKRSWLGWVTERVARLGLSPSPRLLYGSMRVCA